MKISSSTTGNSASTRICSRLSLVHCWCWTVSSLIILLIACCCCCSEAFQFQPPSFTFSSLQQPNQQRQLLSNSRGRRRISNDEYAPIHHSNRQGRLLLFAAATSTPAITEDETIKMAQQQQYYENELSNNNNDNNDIIASLHQLKRYKTQRDVESAIVNLGRKGRTDDALQLYYAVWTLDSLRQQYKTKLKLQQQQKHNEEESSPKQEDDEQIKLQLNNNNQDLPSELTSYIKEQSTKSSSSRTIIRPTTRLMNSAIDACARSTPVRQSTAFDIFNNALSPIDNIHSNTNIKKSGGALSPNVFTFGSLLSCCARNGDISTSLEILKQLEVGDEYPDVILNEVIYSTVISACERSDVPNVRLALEVLNRGILTLSNGSSANTLGKDGEGKEGKMQKTNKKTKGQIMGVVGYNTVISTMARDMQWKKAVQLLGEMILHSSSTHEDDEGGEGISRTNSLFERLEEIRMNSAADSEPLLKHVGRDGSSEEGENSNMVIIIPKPDEVTFGTVLAACERSGEWEELLHVAKAATEYGVKLDGLSLTSVLHSCQQLGLAGMWFRCVLLFAPLLLLLLSHFLLD